VLIYWKFQYYILINEQYRKFLKHFSKLPSPWFILFFSCCYFRKGSFLGNAKRLKGKYLMHVTSVKDIAEEKE